MPSDSIDTVVLYADYTRLFSYFDDWLDAFRDFPRFRVKALNIAAEDSIDPLKALLADAELVVILHSALGDTTRYLEPLVGALQGRRERLLAFVGNEVNLPGTPIRAKRDILQRVAPDFIATQLPLEAGEYLYRDIVGERVLAVPHALNPAIYTPGPAHDDRAIDIGVRAARYLPHLGDNDRNRIHDYFSALGSTRGLKVDISYDRMARGDWAAFLRRCRGTVSTEAGSWYLERDDHTVEAIRRWAKENSGMALTIGADSVLIGWVERLPPVLRRVLRTIRPRDLVQHELTAARDLNFSEVHEKFFRDYEKPGYYCKCISSRHFDAIGSKTCQIMFPGRFNGILRADQHYIALDRDFSNIDDALGRFVDVAHRQRIVDDVYDMVMEGHTYHHRIADLHRELTAG